MFERILGHVTSDKVHCEKLKKDKDYKRMVVTFKVIVLKMIQSGILNPDQINLDDADATSSTSWGMGQYQNSDKEPIHLQADLEGLWLFHECAYRF